MAEQINLKAAGLYLDANPLSEAPPGAMSEASNVVIARPGVVESRAGFIAYNELPPDGLRFLSMYQDTLIGDTGTSLFYRTGSGWTSYTPTYAETAASPWWRTAEAAKNFYFTGAAGVWRLDSVTGEPVAAGAPKALDPTCAIATTSAGLWLTKANQVAYYLTWSFTDANGNVHEGAPSGRVVFANTGSTDCTVDVTVPIISSEMTTAHVFKVYRTDIQDSGIDPGAEAQLVYQRSPTSDEVAAGTLTFEDIVPGALRGATAYFAPSQEGVLSGNDSPPLAYDLCLFRGTMFYARTTSRHRLQLSLLAVGGTDGLQANGTVTINGVTYTAKTTPSAATDFQITTSGTVSQNIEATARALVAAVNRYAAASAGTIGAYYLSGELDAPGLMLFEERGLGGDAFSATASAHAAAWSPQLPTSGTAVSSAADVKPNRLCWSKLQQPEAVPLLNFVDVGSGTAAILRILALRDSLIILKEDGAFRLTGDAGFFRVDLLDSTAVLYAPMTAAVANGRVFGWFSTGILAVSDTGAESVSLGRLDSVLKINAANFTDSNQRNLSFGVTSDADRTYTLSIAGSPGVYSDYVYHLLLDAWTSRSLPNTARNGSCVGRDGTTYVATTVDSIRVMFQQRSGLDSDFCESASVATIDTVTSATELELSSFGDLAAGDFLWQADAPVEVVSISPAGVAMLASPGGTWTTGTVAVLKSIPIAVKYLPATGGTASAKQFTEAAFLFETTPPTALTATFATDLGASASVSLGPGLASNPGELWTWVPPECQRCGRLTLRLAHSVAGERFRLLGVSLKARTYGERRFGR